MPNGIYLHWNEFITSAFKVWISTEGLKPIAPAIGVRKCIAVCVFFFICMLTEVMVWECRHERIEADRTSDWCEEMYSCVCGLGGMFVCFYVCKPRWWYENVGAKGLKLIAPAIGVRKCIAVYIYIYIYIYIRFYVWKLKGDDSRM